MYLRVLLVVTALLVFPANSIPNSSLLDILTKYQHKIDDISIIFQANLTRTRDLLYYTTDVIETIVCNGKRRSYESIISSSKIINNSQKINCSQKFWNDINIINLFKIDDCHLPRRVKDIRSQVDYLSTVLGNIKGLPGYCITTGRISNCEWKNLNMLTWLFKMLNKAAIDSFKSLVDDVNQCVQTTVQEVQYAITNATRSFENCTKKNI